MQRATSIQIDNFIFHLIDWHNPPFYAPSNFSFTGKEKLENFFCTHLRNAINDDLARAANFENKTGCVYKNGLDILKDNSLLTLSSKPIAEHLYQIMVGKKTITPGNLAVILFKMNSSKEQLLGLLKFDPALVVTLKQTATGMDFIYDEGGLPSPRERLQKAAFMIPTSLQTQTQHPHDLWVVDRQTGDDSIAQFFIYDFLGAKETLSDTQRTDYFFSAVLNAANNLKTAKTLNALQADQLSSLARQEILKPVLNVTQWIDSLSKLGYTDETVAEITKQIDDLLPDREFNSDLKLAAKLTAKKIFQGYGFRLEVDTDKESDVIEFLTDDENKGRILIKIPTWDELTK
jgi:hypothetical protein